MYSNDNRTVITLDAGGTNFVFGAMRGGDFITEPIRYPSNAHDLDKCLATILQGFREVISKLDDKPSAISFAFPGPADYRHGIIGGWLPNFPSFRNGVALGPFLERELGLPVFINNDGDLFALGEAKGGILPEINRRVKEMGGSKTYTNLLGYTFGTGLGIGSVINGEINLGNNCCVETFCLPGMRNQETIIEEDASIRGVKREYARLAHIGSCPLEPYDIFLIAEGEREGSQDAAIEAFAHIGREAGHSMASAVILTDSLIVIGGGLTGAAKYILPGILQVLRSSLKTIEGESVARVPMDIYNLDDDSEFAKFATEDSIQLKVYGSEKTVTYCPHKRTGIAVSKIGAPKAISLGAYIFALDALDNLHQR